jgi:hypothetical protein
MNGYFYRFIEGDNSFPDDEIVLPTATPTEVIPVEEVLPVATAAVAAVKRRTRSDRP